MKAAAVQFDVQAGEIELNRQKAAQLITQAAGSGAELVVLPELWNCGYQLDRLAELAENMRGPSVALMRKLAKEHQLYLVGGSIAEKKDNKYYNTCLVFNPQGEIVAKYRKAHLYPHGLNEHINFSPGESWSLTEHGGFQIGHMICYDIFFPEYARNLALRGAQILTVPAESPLKAIHIFEALSLARALENHCYLIFANCSDSQLRAGKDALAGGSRIVSPRGEILAQAGNEETVLLADLEMEPLTWIYEHRNALEDRRPFLDEIDDSQL